jgi:hypothetical protein
LATSSRSGPNEVSELAVMELHTRALPVARPQRNIDDMSSRQPDPMSRVSLDDDLIAGGTAEQATTPTCEARLADACEGWRVRRRCTDASGRQLRDPHPQCLEAQHQYVIALLERGLALPPG